MNYNIVEITGLILFLIGIYGLVARRNIIKTVLSIGVCEIGVITFFLGIRYNPLQTPPIGTDLVLETTADPVPQALMITAIVIGIAVTAVALIMFSALYHRYGTTNWKTAHEIRKKEQQS